MARIEKLSVDAWDPELRAMTQADSGTALEQGLMRFMAHTPEIAKGVAAMSIAQKVNRKLPERLLELVRLRIAFRNQCRSCIAIRYEDAIADGLDEGAVCSLENPMTADNLSPAEKIAIAYGDLLATDHLAIGDKMYAELRAHFTEAQIVELGIFIAVCVGFGRLAATWHMVEELPAEFHRDASAGPLTPWGNESIVVR